jgi:4-amino-4-deoxy-L-arabinose transferase-like glycosyltransferase
MDRTSLLHISSPRALHRVWPVALLGVLVAATFALYSWRLDRAPIYLAHDEVFFGLHAQAVSVNGVDMNGRFLPVFFSDRTYQAGREPVSIYLTALVLKVLPLSERSIRLPTVFIGLLDIILIFAVARRLSGDSALALFAAGLLALAPAHLFYSRLAVDVLYPVPFVLGWLWLLLEFERDARARTLCASTFVLGLAVYAYASAVIAAPAYLALTCAAIALNRQEGRGRLVAIAIAGFAAALVPFVAWHLAHPERYREIVSAYGVYDPKLNVLQGAKDLTSYVAAGDRVGMYWTSLSPAFLFFFGDPGITGSTRHGGLFLLPAAALMMAGVCAFVIRPRTTNDWIVMAGFLIAPLAATVNRELTARRILVILPFGVLLATTGASFLIARFRFGRYLVGAIVALCVYQFVGFYADYLGDYRLRSAAWFEYNMRGAVEQMMTLDERRGGSGTLFVKVENPFAPEYVRFYALKEGRLSFAGRIVYHDVPAGSSGNVTVLRQLVNKGPEAGCASPVPLRLAAIITEPDDKPSFVLCTN